MRINKLTFELFGLFNNQKFDFGPEPESEEPDFHVIYGPNESGKSTLKEGYLRLLYGFPKREPYDYRHQRKNLRVSGEFLNEGVVQTIVRLPTNEPSLRNEHDAPLPEDTIELMLGQISQSDYRNLFCLDDNTIEKGGEEIINAEGDVGRLLFSTKAGISDLSGVLDKVKEEADGIFRSRAKSTQLAQLKQEQGEVERQIKELDIPSGEYRRLKKDLKAAQEEEGRIRKLRGELQAKKSKIEVFIASLPILERVEELELELVDTDHWPQQIDINPEELVQLMPKQSNAIAESKRLTEQLQELKTKLAEIEINQDHLELATRLKNLDELKGRYITANLDLDKRYEERGRIEKEINNIIQGIFADNSLEALDFEFSKQTLTRLEKSRKRIEEAANKVSAQKEEIEGLENRIKKEETNFKRLQESAPQSMELEELLKSYNVDKLSKNHAKASEAIETAERNAKEALRSLKVKGQQFSEIPEYPLTMEEVEDYSKQLEKLNQELESSKKEIEALELEVTNLTGRMKQIKQVDGLVGDEDAQNLKNHRNELWSAHKKDLDKKSAAKFEAALIEYDDAMSGRLENATDLGELRQLEHQISKSRNKLKVMESRVEKITEQIEETENKITNANTIAGLKESLSSRSLESWLRKLETAEKSAKELRQQQEKYQKTMDQALELSEKLQEHVKLETDEFGDLVEEAKSIYENQRSQQENLRSVQGKIQDLKGDIKDRKEKLKLHADELKSSQEEWTSQVAESLPGSVAAEKLSETPEILRDIYEQKQDYNELTHRISEMEKDKKMYSSEVEALASQVGAVADENPLATSEELNRLETAARDSNELQKKIRKQIEDCEEKLENEKRKLNEIDITIDSHAKLLPEDVTTENIGQLREATIKANNIIEKRREAKELQNELFKNLEVDSVEDAKNKLSEQNLTGFQVQLGEVEMELKEAEASHESAIATRSACETKLHDISGNADVAQLVERKSVLELHRQELTLKYLKLNFGYKLAEEAIRRFRDKHRSAMMENTEVAFKNLTNNTYSSLKVVSNGKMERLIAIHENDSSKSAEEMSKGTRFQLYLALRAAAHQQLTEKGTCLPFFCDDIFETFDEDRTRAACWVMKQIGTRGQAIYLTHHQHVVDIAEEICGEQVKIHNF